MNGRTGENHHGVTYDPKNSTRPPLASRSVRKDHAAIEGGRFSPIDLDKNRELLKTPKNESIKKNSSGRNSPIKMLCWGLCNKQNEDNRKKVRAGALESPEWFAWMNKNHHLIINHRPPLKSVELRPRNKRMDKRIPKCYMSRGGDSSISSKTNGFSLSSKSTNDLELSFPHISNANAIHQKNFCRKKSQPPLQKDKKHLYGKIKSFITSDNEEEETTKMIDNHNREQTIRVAVDKNKKDVISPQNFMMDPKQYGRLLTATLQDYDDESSSLAERQDKCQQENDDYYYYDDHQQNLARRSMFSPSPTATETASSESSVASWNPNDKDWQESLSTTTNSHKDDDDDKNNQKKNKKNIEKLWLNGSKMSPITPTTLNTTMSPILSSPDEPNHLHSTPPRSAFHKKQSALTSQWKEYLDKDTISTDMSTRKNSTIYPHRLSMNTKTSSSQEDKEWQKIDEILQKEIIISSSVPRSPGRNTPKAVGEDGFLQNSNDRNIKLRNKSHKVTPASKRNVMNLNRPSELTNMAITFNSQKGPFKPLRHSLSLPSTPTHSFYQSDFCEHSSQNDIDSIGRGDLAYLSMSNSYDDSNNNNSNNSTPITTPVRSGTPKKKRNILLTKFPSFSLPTSPTGSTHKSNSNLSKDLNLSSWKKKKDISTPIRSQSFSPGRMRRGDLSYLSMTRLMNLNKNNSKSSNIDTPKTPERQRSPTKINDTNNDNSSQESSLVFSSISLPSTPTNTLRKSTRILQALKRKEKNKVKSKNNESVNNNIYKSSSNGDFMPNIPNYVSPDRSHKVTIDSTANEPNYGKNSYNNGNTNFLERSQSYSPSRMVRGELTHLSLTRSFSNEAHQNVIRSNHPTNDAKTRSSVPPRPTLKSSKTTVQQLPPTHRPSVSLPSTPIRSRLSHQFESDDSINHISKMKLKKRIIESNYFHKSDNKRNVNSLTPRPITPNNEKSTITSSLKNHSTTIVTTTTTTTTNRSTVIRRLHSRSPSPIMGRRDVHASLSRSFSNDYKNNNTVTPRISIPPRPSTPRATTPRAVTPRSTSKYDNSHHSAALTLSPLSLTSNMSSRIEPVPRLVSPNNDDRSTTSLNENIIATIHKNNEFIGRSQSPAPHRLGRGDLAYHISLSRSFSKDDDYSTKNNSHYTNKVGPEIPVPRKSMRKNSIDALHESVDKNEDGPHLPSKFNVSKDRHEAYNIISPPTPKNEDEVGRVLPSAPKPFSKSIDQLVNKLNNMRAEYNASPINNISDSSLSKNKLPSSLSVSDRSNPNSEPTPQAKSRSHASKHISQYDMTSHSVEKYPSFKDCERKESYASSMNNFEGEDEQNHLSMTMSKSRKNERSETESVMHYKSTSLNKFASNDIISNKDVNQDSLNMKHLNIPHSPLPALYKGFSGQSPSSSLRKNVTKVSRSEEPHINSSQNFEHLPLDMKVSKKTESNVEMARDAYSKRKMLVKYVGSRHDLYGTIFEVVDDSLDGATIRVLSRLKGMPFFVKKSEVEILDGL